MKRNRTTIIGLACGAVCAACVLAYMQGVRGEVDEARAEALARYGGEQLEVCVAKRDIAAGETMSSSAVETKLWVADLLPEGAVRNVSDIEGKRVSSGILAGEVVSERRFLEKGDGVEAPAGLTAVSVPAKDVQAVGGAVVAGSRVDMYAVGGTSTDIVASDVLVLATNASMRDSSTDADVAWITVAIDPASVQEIVTAAQKTELYFTLPGRSGDPDALGEAPVAEREDAGDGPVEPASAEEKGDAR